MDKLEQRELTEWMSLIDEQKQGTILRIPESTEGKEESNPIIIKEGESRLIMTQVNLYLNTSRSLAFFQSSRFQKI